MKKSVLIIVFILLPCVLQAEIIVLKNGRRVEAAITGKTNDYVIVDFNGVSIKLYHDDIETIYAKKPVIPVVSPVPSLRPGPAGDQAGFRTQTRIRQLLALYSRARKILDLMNDLDLVLDKVENQGYLLQYKNNYLWNIQRRLRQFAEAEKLEQRKSNNYISDFQDQYQEMLVSGLTLLEKIRTAAPAEIRRALDQFFTRYAQILIALRREFVENKIEPYKYESISADIIRARNLFVSLEKRRFAVE